MADGPPARVCVVGGAGFIGSHFVDRLLSYDSTQELRVFDNFSSGRRWHLDAHAGDDRLQILEGEVAELETLAPAFQGMETVIHLASNPDIARAMTDPAIDFDQGTFLTQRVVEAARVTSVRQILYASGSGVYGDTGDLAVAEDHGPLEPISTYGSSKLAGEALMASYAHMFGLAAVSFRFGNVVGPRQTHGVGYDFTKRLLKDPTELHILGDGNQSKSYIHVEDVIDAVLLAATQAPRPYAVYNVATGDYVTVTEIAQLAAELVAPNGETRFVYTGGDRGWKGDVPIVRLNTNRIRDLGWRNRRTATDALRASIVSMVEDAREGRLS